MADGATTPGGGGGVLRTAQANDDLVSVTVRKSSPDQKSGIGLIERSGAVYVTKITENGLFHGSELAVGDIVLSINGIRMRPGEGERSYLKPITQATAIVTLTVKKADKKAQRGARSISPVTRRRKAREAEREAKDKIYRGLAKRNPDGSFNYSAADGLWNTPTNHNDETIEDDTIIGKKIFPKQDVGIQFVEIDNKLFISYISTESIFFDTNLEIGDRIIEINEMSFREYVNVKYAMKIIQKEKEIVTLEIEKGHLMKYKTEILEATAMAAAAAATSTSDDENNENDISKKKKLRKKLKQQKKSTSSTTKKEQSDKNNEKDDDDDDESVASSVAVSDTSSVSISSEDSEDIISHLMKQKKESTAITAAPTTPGRNKSPSSGSFRGRSPGAGRARGRSPGTARPLRFKEKGAMAEVPTLFSPRRKSKDRPLIIEPDENDHNNNKDTTSSSTGAVKSTTTTTTTTKRPASPRKRSKDPPNILGIVESSSSTTTSTVNAPYELNDDLFGGYDFICMTISNDDENDNNVLVQRNEVGKFLISQLPSHETRISIGDEVLGINGIKLGGLTSLDQALSFLQKSKKYVKLIIKF